MNATTNLTNPVEIEKRLEEINETLSSISAKEVLFIIILSFLALFAAINMCLLILERKKKRKLNSVPQAIVIQPNNVKSDNKSTRNEKSKMSSGYEKDVLPSKSMKMKVSISPSMSNSRKARVPSKESITEDSQLSKTEPSNTEKSIKKQTVPPPSTVPLSAPQPLENAASADVTTAVEPVSPSLIQIQPSTSAPPATPSTSTSSSSSSVAPSVPHISGGAPTRAENSQSNESSMTSFTAPEDPSTVRSRGGIALPKDPSTPSATTLSGLSSTPESTKTLDMSTAKDVTTAKSPMVRTPDVLASPAPPPPNIPINTSTPPPNNEKKVRK
ncbi:hypothetical protein CAEBREN_30767 [Caenorhabditis brenneri]|uniref:Uncharacterized protein n=1 Tax=Caenorhabditis brenneri TaxID=135651 RepID=G0PKU5_CAEBE|nr:hypothetical protein CAEBREN_30767 [Caenorhabditis brenneri]